VNYTLRLRPELVDDAHEAFTWYETVAPGLGHEFLRCYFACAATISRQPLLYRKVHRDFRRALLAASPTRSTFLSRARKSWCFCSSTEPGSQL
jgi:toxin ParE1/3/4